MRKKAYVTVEAEVSLDEFDVSDLIEYLTEQGYTVAKADNPGGAWIQLYETLRYKPDPLSTVRQIVCDATGRIL